jgi:hypothetical protein
MAKCPDSALWSSNSLLRLNTQKAWAVSQDLIAARVSIAELVGGEWFDDLGQMEVSLDHGHQNFLKRSAVAWDNDRDAKAFPRIRNILHAEAQYALCGSVSINAAQESASF